MLVNPSHILVIDDNDDILMMLGAVLKHRGYKVSTKNNSENIESFITDLAPDLILMDMLLSGADGCEICKTLKANSALSGIPVIMISAHPQAKAICLAAGANCYLDKPFEMSELLRTVTTMLAT